MNKKQVKHRHSLTLKKKIIIAFVFIILVLSFSNLISIFISKTSISKFDNMIELLFVTNEIESISIKIPGKLSEYNFSKNDQNLTERNKQIADIERNIKILKDSISGFEGQWLISDIEKSKGEFKDSLNKITENKKALKPDDNISIIEDTKKTQKYISNSIKSLISNRLNFNKELKKKLSNESNMINLIIIGDCDCSGIFIYYCNLIVFQSDFQTFKQMFKECSKILQAEKVI